MKKKRLYGGFWKTFKRKKRRPKAKNLLANIAILNFALDNRWKVPFL